MSFSSFSRRISAPGGLAVIAAVLFGLFIPPTEPTAPDSAPASGPAIATESPVNNDAPESSRPAVDDNIENPAEADDSPETDDPAVTGATAEAETTAQTAASAAEAARLELLATGCPVGEIPSPGNRNPQIVDTNVSVYAGTGLELSGGVAEIEGVVVVEGDMRVTTRPARRVDLGAVGVGSGVIPGAGAAALSVSGNLTATSGNSLAVNGGRVQVGGSFSPRFPSSSWVFSAGGRDGMGAAATRDWASFGSTIRQSSTDYAAMRTTGRFMYGNTFEGTGAKREVFSITAAALSSATEIDFSDIRDDAPIIINVRGARVNWAPVEISEEGKRVDVATGRVNGFGSFASRILWNFVDAESITLGGSSQILGTVLAPGNQARGVVPTVNVTASTNGRMLTTGSLRFSGTSNEHHNYPFVEPPFTCVPTLPEPEPELPALEVSKSVDPDTGTAVIPGQVVNYTIGFRNVSSVPAPVNHVDRLDDVLDDAEFDDDSLRAGAPLTATRSGAEIQISGTLAAGSTAQVTYRVTVKSTERLGDRVLKNLVIPADTETPDCEDALACTENPVTPPADPPRWTLDKSALPESGAEVSPGDTVDYWVTATGLSGTVAEAQLVDDLTDVLHSASFVSGSATLTVGTAAPIRVADPVNDRLTTPRFELPAGTQATLRYRVSIAENAWAATIRNVAWGTSATPPDACTPEQPCKTEHHTPVQGIVLPLTGGSGTVWMLVAGTGGLLAITIALGARRLHTARHLQHISRTS